MTVGTSVSLSGQTPYTLVWQPLDIGPVKVKHRIMQTPHGVAWGTNLPYARQVAYYSERAKGGAALVCVGATAVHRRNATGDPERPGVPSEQAAVPLYANLAGTIHGYGAAVFVEFAEGGAHDMGRRFDGTWRAIVAPSDIPSVVRNEVPVPVSHEMIRELLEDYRKGARNLQEAGVDGITIHAAHSYLFGQFMSPAYNRRTDEYGGSPENCCRLLLQVAQEIRDEIGTSMALGVRLSYNEFVPEQQGITPELSDQYLHILVERGLFDYFDISTGGYHSLDRSVPPMQLPDAHIAGDSKRAKQIVGDRARIFVAGRVNSVALAERLLADGATDMVGMTRAQIADPFLVSKTLEGRETEINHCVGSNECIYNSHMSQGLVCTANPAAGREAKWGSGTLQMVEPGKRKHVVVVGAGTAGMRAAEVAARRGHQVTVLEEEDEVGGWLGPFSQLPLRQGWHVLVDNLERQLEHLKVPVETGHRATRDDIIERGPDAVVVATGFTWDSTGFTTALPGRATMPGADWDRVLTFDAAVKRSLGDPTSLGRRVAIIDETGDYQPLALAEQLAGHGGEVIIFSRMLAVGALAFEAHELRLAMQRLVKQPVSFMPQTIVLEVGPERTVYRSLWGGEEQTLVPFDTVVLCMLRRARRDLYDEIVGHVPEAHLVGDALSPRRPADAMYDGEEVGRLL